MLFVFFNHMFPALQYLPAINQASGNEVNARLYPQCLVLGRYFIECGSHAVDAHIAVDAECGGEDVQKYFQKAGMAAPGQEMPERNSNGTEVNTNISMHVSRLRMAMDAVMAKKMQAAR